MNSKLKKSLFNVGKSFLVLVVLVLFSFKLHGQQIISDKSFIDIFNRETGGNNQSDSNLIAPIPVKAVLPAKFSESFSLSGHFSIGISDPEVDPETGFRQAYHRALMLGALQQKSSVKMVSENFAKQKEKSNTSRSKYEEMYRIEATISLNDSFSVVDSYRLSSKETIVLISFPQSLYQTSNSGRNKLFRNEKRNNIKVSCALYHLENIANRSQQIFRTEYETTRVDTSKAYPRNEKFCYTNVNGRWCKLSTWFDGKEATMPNARYYYFNKYNNQKNDSLLNKSVGATATEGLWPALVTSILWQMSGNASGNFITFKEVTDYYNKTVISFNSTVENKILKFNIKRMIMDSNCLYPILDIETQNSEKK
jgi:hypothetical protein